MEYWSAIPDWEGHYEVSSEGRVRSVDRELRYENGLVRKYKGSELALIKDKKGYHKVVLKAPGRKRQVKAHRLVAETFIPNPENHPFVLHRDDNKDNNSVSNLRWGTHLQNEADKRVNGGHHNSRKTHCINGHEFNELNTRYTISSLGSVHRECLICKSDRSRQDREKAKSIEPPSHGTWLGYNSYSCRCDDCRKAASDYQRSIYAKRKRGIK